jgi:hypothetical protein
MPLVEPVTRAWRLASDIGVSPRGTARRDRPRRAVILHCGEAFEGFIALQTCWMTNWR